MAKVTSKLQVTVPKVLADRYGIAPGDEIDWEAGGDAIRVVPSRRKSRHDVGWRCRLFDQATERQQARQRPAAEAHQRGWRREELYERGRSG